MVWPEGVLRRGTVALTTRIPKFLQHYNIFKSWSKVVSIYSSIDQTKYQKFHMVLFFITPTEIMYSDRQSRTGRNTEDISPQYSQVLP